MKYFSSSIADKRLTDFQKYDSSLREFKKRLDLVNNMIMGEDDNLHEFLTTYFAQYYVSSPAQNGHLSEEDAVCKTIEGLGTYLLNAKDIQSNRKVKYRFWKSEREFKQYKESSNVNTSTLEAGLEEGVQVIDMFYSNDEKNFKLDTNQKLYARDLRDIEEIKTLQNGIDTFKLEGYVQMIEKHIDDSLPIIEDEKDKARLVAIRRNVENYLQKWASTMSDNQILIKEAVKKPIRFKSPMKDEGAPDKLEDFDFMEAKEVMALLPFLSSDDLMSDVGVLAHDLNTLIDRAKLSKRELEIVSLLREGYSVNDAQDEIGLLKQNMKTYMERISKKVVKVYEIDVSEYREKQRLKKHK